ncbi:hypothetical protein SmJEL517_g02240 [Synchytrium microbalum]|uniref:ELMO domain-containing protein n=1 Tax=Synchytrium microbalum TaxID=1806994 RepID=A0A507C7N4_9FUNG|nr:uncharacterized protein SmJEL517_g02240 [Synchytrium microbalum]TPX35338.1 hypothetical protein SmJEL517_g02240 [Synchytrium microbalum]
MDDRDSTIIPPARTTGNGGIKTTVTYGLNRIDFTFDMSQSVASNIKDLWSHFNLAQSGPPSNFCLRLFDTEEHITDENVRKRIDDGITLKLTWSPAITARDLADDLDSTSEQTLKKATFALQKYIKEPDFVEEFLARKGGPKLQKIVETTQGNTLAYALSSLQNLMDNDYGWDTFSREFISTLVNIIVKQNLVNICRPATSCIIKLVVADKTSTGSVRCYGYPVVEEAISVQPALLHTLCQRLNATDYSLQLYSMSLINCLFRYASPDRKRSEFFRTLDMLNIRAIVVRLMNAMNARPGEELAAQLVEFQRLFIQEMNRRKRTPVDPNQGVHERILGELWRDLGAPAYNDGSKWKLLGFNTENVKKEFSRVGVLGLELLQSAVKRDRDYHAKFIHDQLARPVERRCPWGRAQIESIEVLCDYWEISSGYTTSTSYQPLLLSFEAVQAITFRCFVRLWAEMEAQSTGDDANRVAAVVRSQLWWCLGRIKRTEKDALNMFEKSMLETPYSVVRERQVRELENADDLSSKAIVRTLRDRLSAESYQFIKQQRIGCLIAGAWFPIFREKGRDKKMMRFYRLSPNRQYLHYGDFTEGFDRKPSIEELPERVDMSLATDILRGNASPVFSSKRNASEDLELCFSLVSSTSSSDGVANTSHTTQTLGDFGCGTPDRCSEWADGFAMLLDKNIMTQPTSELIRELVEIAVQVALLDLTGEGCLPNASTVSQIEVPELPRNMEFWFDGRTPSYVAARATSGVFRSSVPRVPSISPLDTSLSQLMEKTFEKQIMSSGPDSAGYLDFVDSYQERQ